MADETRRRMEMEAALKQIKSVQKRQARNRKRAWRLDLGVGNPWREGFQH